MGKSIHEKMLGLAKKSSDIEIDIANQMDFVLMRQCRVDGIELQLSEGVLYLYDAEQGCFLKGPEAYEYFKDCIDGLTPTAESKEIEEYFKANPVKPPVEGKK